MSKRLIGIIGFFGNGLSTAGGQEAKTCALTRLLQTHYGESAISTVDTNNWKKSPVCLFIRASKLAVCCKNVIMLPAQNSVRLFAPLFVLLRAFCRCKIHYAVVGGWLPKLTKEKKTTAWFLKKLDGIYVETGSMKRELEKQGFSNVSVMPNFKFVTRISLDEIPVRQGQPFRICIFSRIMKEKGVEDAIDAVIQVNKGYGRTVLILDIYGKIDPEYEVLFRKMMSKMPPYIQYCGIVEPEQSVEVLKDYFALLFPTYYDGEGFAGTLLDAMASGVPVVASDWRYNAEIVKEGQTGLLFPARDVDALTERLKTIVADAEKWNAMRPVCLQEAQKYLPEEAVKVLLKRIEA